MASEQLPPLVIVHPHFTLPGGAGKVVLELGNRITKKRRVIAVAQTIWPAYRAQYPEIQFISLRGPVTSTFRYWLLWPWWVLRTHRILHALEQQYGPLIILSNVFPAQWTGLLFTKFHRTSRSLWFCQEPSAFIHNEQWRRSIKHPVSRMIAYGFQPSFAAFDRWLAHSADSILANSEFCAKMVERVYQRQSTVVYPGITPSEVPQTPWSDREKTILAIGRFTKFKYFDMIIQAFAQANLPDYSLLLIGDGEEKQALLTLIEHLGMNDRITIKSGLPDEELSQIYHTSRILIMASREEPFGMVVTEAMAAGMIAIAHRSGGPMETVVDGDTGTLVETHAATAFATALRDLVASDARLEAMSNNARRRAETKFTWELASERLNAQL